MFERVLPSNLGSTLFMFRARVDSKLIELPVLEVEYLRDESFLFLDNCFVHASKYTLSAPLLYFVNILPGLPPLPTHKSARSNGQRESLLYACRIHDRLLNTCEEQRSSGP